MKNIKYDSPANPVQTAKDEGKIPGDSEKLDGSDAVSNYERLAMVAETLNIVESSLSRISEIAGDRNASAIKKHEAACLWVGALVLYRRCFDRPKKSHASLTEQERKEFINETLHDKVYKYANEGPIHLGKNKFGKTDIVRTESGDILAAVIPVMVPDKEDRSELQKLVKGARKACDAECEKLATMIKESPQR